MNIRLTLAVILLICVHSYAQQKQKTALLPAEITAKRSGNKIQINWKMDEQHDLLILERSSNNMHFNLLEVIYPEKKEINEDYFQTSDPSPLAGVGYYRLKYPQDDAPDSYSESVSVFYNFKVREVTINPNSGLKQALIKIRSAGESEFSVLDETGEPIRKYRLSLPANAEHMLDLRKLPEGKYYIQVINNEKKFLKQITL